MAIPTIFAKVQQLENQISLLSNMPKGDASDVESIHQRLNSIEGLLQAKNETEDKINSVKNEVAKIPDALLEIEAKILDLTDKISALPTSQVIEQLVAKVEYLENQLAQVPP